MENPIKYLVITDANYEIGSGHVMRQVALANYARAENFDPFFVSFSKTVGEVCFQNNLKYQIIESINDIIEIKNKNYLDRVIIDVHEKDFPYYRKVCENIYRSLLVVSEVGYPFEYFGNYLIKFGSHLNHWEYKDKSMNESQETEILGGRSYVFFREEFSRGPGLPAKERPREVLICHGGSDPYQLTQRTLRALETTENSFKVTALIGSSFKDTHEIKILSNDSKHECEVVEDCRKPSDFMRRASVAVINGGNIRYELCVTETPFVAISFQERQFHCTKQISDLEVGRNLGVMDHINDQEIGKSVEDLIKDTFKRQQMQDIMGRLFDLRGQERFLNLLY